MRGYLVAMRKWLVLVPLFAVISLGVTSLVLARQQPVYEAEAILEYCRDEICYMPDPLFRFFAKEETIEMALSNVIRVALSPELTFETCQKLGQPITVATSCIFRASASIQRRSRLISLTVEGFAPQIVADYANAWASALSSHFKDADRHEHVIEVERAFPPCEPITPRWAETLLIAGAIASGIGLICAFLAAYLLWMRAQKESLSANRFETNDRPD